MSKAESDNMSPKDPYSLDEFDELNDLGSDLNQNVDPYAHENDPIHFDPSIAPEQGFPDSSLENTLEKTMLHEVPGASSELPVLDEATDVSEAFYEKMPPLENEGQPLGNSVLQLTPDMAVQVTAMIGRKSTTIKDLLDLKIGDVVEFDRKPMDPLDIVVAGQVIAKAELVVVDGRLGVRILKLFK